MADLSEFKQVTFKIDDRGTCIFPMNAELASILVSNLIKNALVHNHAGGSILITLEKNGLSIENTGQTIPLNKQELFKRFYKQSSSSASTGLGLAIVKSITDYYNIHVVYDFRDSHHFFTVRFNEQ